MVIIVGNISWCSPKGKAGVQVVLILNCFTHLKLPPSGNENTRSMVIEVGYKGFKMLLTGDFRLRRQGEISNPIKGSNQDGDKE